MSRLTTILIAVLVTVFTTGFVVLDAINSDLDTYMSFIGFIVPAGLSALAAHSASAAKANSAKTIENTNGRMKELTTALANLTNNAQNSSDSVETPPDDQTNPDE